MKELGKVLQANGRRVIFAGGLLLAGLALSVNGTDAGQGRIVRTQGDNQFVPNVKIASTLKFTPGHVVVDAGETLTLSHTDKTFEPHTLSIVNEDEVPGDIDEVFGCGEPGSVCDDIFQIFPAEPTDSVFQNAPGTGPGIDGRLDSLFVVPGGSASAEVTAAPGSTLYYICAIHAWMQGRIDVK